MTRLLLGPVASVVVALSLVVRTDALPQPPPSGQPRLYIAAVRDSRLFTLCPPTALPEAGEQPIADGVTLVRWPGRSDKQVVRVSPTREYASLYVPRGSEPAAQAELDHDLVSWDDDTAAVVATEIRAHRGFRVVASEADADLVFLVEAQHETVAASSGRLGGGTATIAGVGGDREANFLMALFGVLVPAEDFRNPGRDVAALVRASLWSGLALARQRDRRAATTAPQWEPASIESLAKQLRDRAERPRGFPPVCPASAGALARDPPAFRSGMTYVSVPVIVEDEAGAPITDLTDGDFRIFEDESEQPIDRVLTLTAPVDLAFLVDTSSSMRLERPQLQRAILSFVDTMRPQDRVLMASFDDRLFVQAEFTSDRSQLRQAVSELARGVGTRLYDIVALTVERRLEGTKDRQAIVLLTDGVDTHSRLADAAMTRALVDRSHLAVYVVQYDTRRSDYQLPTGIRVNGRSIDSMQLFALPEGAEDNSRLFERAHAYLAGLAKASGGRLYRAETAGSLTAVLQQIAGELGRQYTIGYYPANQARDGTYRALRVQVNRHGAQVRTRAGYTAAPGPR